MKNLKMKLLTLLASLILIVLFGCSESSTVNPDDNNQAKSYEIPVIEVLPGDIQDATIDSEMTLTPGQEGMDGFELNLLFNILDLSEGQIYDFEIKLNLHAVNIEEELRKFRVLELEIVADANSKRKIILENLNKGSVSDEDAAVEIEKINSKARLDIQLNCKKSERQMFIDRVRFIGKIYSVLDSERQKVWHEYTHSYYSIFYGEVN